MTSSTPYLSALLPALPSSLSTLLSTSPAEPTTLDILLRFVSGGPCPLDASPETSTQWAHNQAEAQKALTQLSESNGTGKRKRDNDETIDDSDTKRSKPSLPQEDSPALYTLHALSASSPIRKKVDITISQSSVTFSQASSTSPLARVALGDIAYAFLLPTRGKQKAHWTVVLLRPHGSKGEEVVFGVDASAPAGFATTDGVVQKGAPTLPALRAFLAHLPCPVLEPDTGIFRSACAVQPKTDDGAAGGIDAHRAAKPGTLWFLKEGLLWNAGRGCEFWALGELEGGEGALRVVSATGRTCSVYLSRKREGDGDGEEGEETEFGGVDGREMEGIREWMRVRRNRFGKEETVAVNKDKGKGKEKAQTEGGTDGAVDEESDPEDSDFTIDSDDEDGGSVTSSDSASGSGSEAGGSDAEGSTEESGGEAEGVDGDGNDDEEAEDEEELDPAHHPLLRADAAMPRLSRAMVEAVVDTIESDMLGGGEAEMRDQLEEEDELEE